VKIEFDPEYGLLYIELREGEAEETVDLAKGAHLDLDAEGRVLGLEFLSLGAFEHYMRGVGVLEVSEEGLTTWAPRGARDSAVLSRTSLTPRQREVVELLAEGMTNREIAERLGLSEATVRQHLHNLYKALGVRNRDEARTLLAT